MSVVELGSVTGTIPEITQGSPVTTHISIESVTPIAGKIQGGEHKVVDINGKIVVVVSGGEHSNSSCEYIPTLTKSLKKRQKVKERKARANVNSSGEKSGPPSHNPRSRGNKHDKR